MDPKEPALKAHLHSTSKPEVPVDFATLFHTASVPGSTWPKAVQAWGEKSPDNQYVLDALRSESTGNPHGGGSPLALVLISEVLKAVGGH